MQRVIDKPYRRWTVDEKLALRQCRKEQLPKFAEKMGLALPAVAAMWRHQHEEKTTDMAVFDYSKIIPSKALFVRCPVCGGTTTVNENAYCRSCLSQWHPITLEPLEGLHDSDPW